MKERNRNHHPVTLTRASARALGAQREALSLNQIFNTSDPRMPAADRILEQIKKESEIYQHNAADNNKSPCNLDRKKLFTERMLQLCTKPNTTCSNFKGIGDCFWYSPSQLREIVRQGECSSAEVNWRPGTMTRKIFQPRF